MEKHAFHASERQTSFLSQKINAYSRTLKLPQGYPERMQRGLVAYNEQGKYYVKTNTGVTEKIWFDDRVQNYVSVFGLWRFIEFEVRFVTFLLIIFPEKIEFRI